MPRPRPRTDPCDCLDCADPVPSSSSSPLPPHLASARQQPPPKCVLVLADGVLTEEATGVGSLAPHADAVARRGCTGVLSLAEGAGSLLEQVVLGAGQPTPSLPARFNVLSAALVTTDAGAAASLAPASLDAIRVLPRVSQGRALADAAIELLGGAQALATSDGSDRAGVELVVVHVCDAEGRDGDGDATTSPSSSSTTALTTIDAILQAVARLPASPSTILTVLVLGGPAVRLPPAGGTPTSVPGILRPTQSYEMDDAGDPTPLSSSAAFIATRCVGATRVDGVTSVDAAAAAGGALAAAPAGAVLADVAFKLGRASKYGA